jgi:hypothetical protein
MEMWLTCFASTNPGVQTPVPPEIKVNKAVQTDLPLFSREKKLLVSSEDYGRDLTGVQNLRKKHKRLEAELAAHEPAIQVREHLRLRGQRGGKGAR